MKVLVMIYYVLISSMLAFSLPRRNKATHFENELNNNGSKDRRYSKLLSISYEELSHDLPQEKIESRSFSTTKNRDSRFCESCNSEPWIPVVKFSQRAPKKIIYQPDFNTIHRNHFALNKFLVPPNSFLSDSNSNSFTNQLGGQLTPTTMHKTLCDLNNEKHQQDTVGSGSEPINSVNNVINHETRLRQDSNNKSFQFYSFVKHPINFSHQNISTSTKNQYSIPQPYDLTSTIKNNAVRYSEITTHPPFNYRVHSLKPSHETITINTNDHYEEPIKYLPNIHKHINPSSSTSHNFLLHQVPVKSIPLPLISKAQSYSFGQNIEKQKKTDFLDTKIVNEDTHLTKNNHVKTNEYPQFVENEYQYPVNFLTPPRIKQPQNFNFDSFVYYKDETQTSQNEIGEINEIPHSTEYFESEIFPRNKKEDNLKSSQSPFIKNHMKPLSSLEWQCFLTNFIQYLKKNKAGIPVRMSRNCDPVHLQRSIKGHPSNDQNTDFKHDSSITDNNNIILSDYTTPKFEYTTMYGKAESQPEIIKLAPHLAKYKHFNDESSLKNYSWTAQKVLNQFIIKNALESDIKIDNTKVDAERPLQTSPFHLNSINNLYSEDSVDEEAVYEFDSRRLPTTLKPTTPNEVSHNQIEEITELQKPEHTVDYTTEDHKLPSLNSESVKSKFHIHAGHEQNLVDSSNLLDEIQEDCIQEFIQPEDNVKSSEDFKMNQKNYSVPDLNKNALSESNAVFFPKGFSFSDHPDFVTEKPILLTAPKKIKIVIPYRKRSYAVPSTIKPHDTDFQNNINTWTADKYSNHKHSSFNSFNNSKPLSSFQKSKSIPLLYLPLNSTDSNKKQGSELLNNSENFSKTWEELTVAISPYTKERVYVVTPKSN